MTEQKKHELSEKQLRLMGEIQEADDEMYELQLVIDKSDPAFEGALIKQIKKDIHILENTKKRLMKEILTPPDDLIK